MKQYNILILSAFQWPWLTLSWGDLYSKQNFRVAEHMKIFGIPLVLYLTVGLMNQCLAAGDHEHHHDDDHHENHYHQEAHVHGLAKLTLVYEQGALEIEFESPTNNLVGFEYQASTQSEIDRVAKVKALLSDTSTLFEPQGARCQLVSSNIDLSAIEALSGHQAEHHHEDHGHDKHEHEKHAHEDHDSEQESTHSEAHASYRFTCDTQPKAIEVQLINHFPAIELLEAQWISDNGQGAQQLSGSQNLLNLSR
jgi:ABC-type Zn2+ transport system substrate-binding protein/surface adhesin